MINKYLKYLPTLILLLGAAWRIAGIGAAAIWHDEAVTYYRTQLPLFSLTLNNSEQAGDLLLELIERPLMLISHSVWVLRLPSLIAGLVSLWLVWLLMRRLYFNPFQQIISSIFIAFLPGLLWLAQDARSYSLLACFFLAALYFALEGRWLGLIACCGLMEYTHNTAPAFILATLCVAWFCYPWKFRKVILSGLLIGLAYIPQLLFAISHNFGGLSLSPIPPLSFPWVAVSTVQAFLATSLGPEYGLFFLCLLFVTLIGLIVWLIHKRARNSLILSMAFALPLLILLGLSIWSNVYLYRTIMPMLIPFCLWLGWELGKKGWRFDFFRNYLAVSWTFLIFIGLIFWRPADRGGYVDEIAVSIRSAWQPGDILVYSTQSVALPFDYYLSDKPHIWPDWTSGFFLDPPGLKLISDTGDLSTVQREWILIPDDVLLSENERQQLSDMVKDAQLFGTVTYMQSSPINIYLLTLRGEQ